MQEIPAMTQDVLVDNLARMSTIHQRIKAKREQGNLSMEALAERVGVSWQTVQQWENGKTAPQRKRLDVVAAALGTTVDHLVTGEPSELHGSSVREPQAPYGRAIDLSSSPETIEVRRVIFKISAGIAGFSVEHLDNGEGVPLFFSSTWAAKRGLDPARLYATRVSGDSMEPGLHDGDTIIINTADTKQEKGAVYAVNHDGEFTVKRLRYELKRWYLFSDNPDMKRYPPVMCGDATYILGRVVLSQSESL